MRRSRGNCRSESRINGGIRNLSSISLRRRCTGRILGWDEDKGMEMGREGTSMGRDTTEGWDTETEEEEVDSTRLLRPVSSTTPMQDSTMDKSSTAGILDTILIHLNSTPRLPPPTLCHRPTPTTPIILILNNSLISSSLNSITFLSKGTDTEEASRCEILNLKVNPLPSSLNHRMEDGDTSTVSLRRRTRTTPLQRDSWDSRMEGSEGTDPSRIPSLSDGLRPTRLVLEAEGEMEEEGCWGGADREGRQPEGIDRDRQEEREAR
jgi:hypothetical protein